jgi:hypothetical protein
MGHPPFVAGDVVSGFSETWLCIPPGVIERATCERNTLCEKIRTEVEGFHAFYQHHAFENPVDSLPAILPGLCPPVPAAGKDIVRISRWEPSKRSKMDLLDDDRLG